VPPSCYSIRQTQGLLPSLCRSCLLQHPASLNCRYGLGRMLSWYDHRRAAELRSAWTAECVSSSTTWFTFCSDTSFTLFGSTQSASQRSTAVERWLARSSSRITVRQ